MLWNKIWRKKSFKRSKKKISRNEETKKRVLKEIKIKKFNYLKHKPDTVRNQKTSETTAIQDTLKPTYASNTRHPEANICKQYKIPWSQHMQAIQDTLKPTYASILKNNTNVASNSINEKTNPTGERPTLQQKLRSLTSKHSRSRSKSPTRKA